MENAANIRSISITSTALKSHPTTSKQPPQYPSHSSRDGDSFLCTPEERQSNLLFGDLISNPKETGYNRLLFQNINSLEISSGHYTLELMCDSIG